jgi:hydrophobic/amphiphilic exporter-1 (mainly G- bacteria), HAE1 family
VFFVTYVVNLQNKNFFKNMTLTEIAIKRPSLIIVLFSVLIGAGLLSYKQLSYELLPDFSQPVITITTPYPGASPSEVEQQVSKKIEDAMSGLEGLSEVNSKSLENASLVLVWFKHGTNLDVAVQDAQRKLENVKSTLPSGIKSSSMSKISPNDQPVLQLSATSNLSEREFRQKITDEILPQIQQAKGVAEITLLGGEQREIRINVNTEKLNAYRLPLIAVTGAIKQANLEFPTGKVKSEAEQMTVRLAGKFNSIDELRRLIVASPPFGSPIYLQDVADVQDAVADRASIFRSNGQNGLGILIKKQSDANAVTMSKEVRAKLATIEQSYTKENVKFDLLDDSSQMTSTSVEAVTHDLEIAIILVALVMLLFLHSLRSSLIVLVAIPTSLISTFIAMYALGYTLNLMTLLAMSLVIGILVDDSIVVLENIFRHLEMGKDRRTAALDGRNEIGFTALAITLVDVVVFTPIMFTNTTISEVLMQFSMVVVVSTLMSLLVCFTLTPWLASRFATLTHLNEKNPLQWILIQFEKGLNNLTEGYVKWVDWALKNKTITLGAVVFLFFLLGQIMKMGIVGSEFIAEGDQGKMILNLDFDKKTPLSQNNLISKQIEDYLAAQPDIKAVFANVGGPKSGLGGTGQGDETKTQITVIRTPEGIKQKPTPQRLQQLRDTIESRFAGIETYGNNVGLVASAEAPIQIVFSGANREEVLKAAQKIQNQIKTMPGAKDSDISSSDTKGEIRVEVDRERMAKLDLNMATVGMTLQNAFTGDDNSLYRDNGNEYTMRIMLDAFDRKNINDVKNMVFTTNKGQIVRLTDFANIYETQSAAMLERKARHPSVMLTAYVLGAGSGTIADKINTYVKENPMPEGVTMAWDGEIKRQKESFGALGMATGIALILVYLIMVALYDDFVYPFVVLFSIPVAVLGALLAINLTGLNMGIFAGLGMIMLMGLVAKNAILIVDFANHLKTEGKKTSEALLSAVRERMRPILMTTIAMVIGMIPIATAKGAGAEWKNSLAWVLIGGLTSSMILTVVIVPVMYQIVDNLKAFFGGLGRKKEAVG